MNSFKNTLDYMKTGQVFTCLVISFNEQKDEGGEVLEYRGILVQAKNPNPSTRSETPKEFEDRQRKDPNHFKHYTRNIKLVTEDDFVTTIIKKIHIPLIVSFNGQKTAP